MSATPRQWIARTCRGGDGEGTLELRRAVYPDLKHVRDNPAGPGVIALADHHGKIVRHTAEMRKPDAWFLQTGDSDEA